MNRLIAFLVHMTARSILCSNGQHLKLLNFLFQYAKSLTVILSHDLSIMEQHKDRKARFLFILYFLKLCTISDSMAFSEIISPCHRISSVQILCLGYWWREYISWLLANLSGIIFFYLCCTEIDTLYISFSNCNIWVIYLLFRKSDVFPL